jgi:hypothetical protein
MSKTFTREYLQSLPAQKRAEGIALYADRIVAKILDAAEKGKTGFIYEEKHYRHYVQGWAHRVPVVPTMEELTIALQERFPDCKVELQEFWIDVRPGVREQRCQIVIDWTPPGKSQDIGTLNTSAIPAQPIRL